MAGHPSRQRYRLPRIKHASIACAYVSPISRWAQYHLNFTPSFDDISDALGERRAQLSAAFADEDDDLHLSGAADHAEALEGRDYYTVTNAFWAPAGAPWETTSAGKTGRH